MPVSTSHANPQPITAVDINALAALANANEAGLTGKLAATDPSVTNARVPSGAAGGGLGGTFPNPTVNAIAVPGGVSATGVAGATTFLRGDGSWQVPAAVAFSSLAYAATVTPVVSAAINVYEVGTLTGNVTVANPTGAASDGMTMVFRFAQDATGGRTSTFGAAYVFGTDVAANLIPTALNSQYELTFRYHALTSAWRCVGIVRGFTS